MELSSKEKGDQGEALVLDLAARSYLSHWCFPNPRDEDGDRKEIADLLIWLNDVLILISIKNYEFNGDHEKYHRKTVEKAVRQIQGAERKLLHSGRDIAVLHPTRGRVVICSSTIKQVIRLIINLGEGEEYYEAGRETSKDRFISILDRDTIETAFEELDTIRDLVGYFVAREGMFRSLEKTMIAGREKDLLAVYMQNARQMPDVTGYAAAAFDIEGAWEGFKSHPQKIARDKDNEESFFVDELVSRELLQLKNGSEIAEPLMLLSRLERRAFAKAFFEKYEEFGSTVSLAIADSVLHLKRYQTIGGVGFTFLFYQKKYEGAKIPHLLQIAMYGHAINDGFAAKSLWAIATDEEVSRFYFCYDPNPSGLPVEGVDAIRHDLALLGWNMNLKTSSVNLTEFPDVDTYNEL